jgi:hypothetical protein
MYILAQTGTVFFRGHSKLSYSVHNVSFSTGAMYTKGFIPHKKYGYSQCLRWGGMRRDGIPFLFEKA